MKNISIIIVTYNSISLIKDCIDSIFKYNDLDNTNLEIIVVDNSSKEVSKETFSLLKQHYNEKVVLIRNNINGGYGQGNNMGIQNSNGDIICIMNPDIRLREPIFKNTVSEFTGNSNLAMLGYKQIGGFDLSYYLKPEYDLSFLSSPINKYANQANLFIPKYFYLSGAFFFLDKNKFQKINCFDKNLFLFFEESDICRRLLKNSFDIKFNNKYSYIHLVKVDQRRDWSEKFWKIGINSGVYYFKKYNMNGKRYYRKKAFEFGLKMIYAKLISNKAALLKARNQYKSMITTLNNYDEFIPNKM